MGGRFRWMGVVILGGAVALGAVALNARRSPTPPAAEEASAPPERPVARQLPPRAVQPQPTHHPEEVAGILDERNTAAAASAGRRLEWWRELRVELERLEADVPAFVAVDDAIAASAAVHRSPHRVDVESETRRERDASIAIGRPSTKASELLERIRAELEAVE